MKQLNQSITVFITMVLVICGLFKLRECKELKECDLKIESETNKISCLTEKIDTNIYKKRITFNSEDSGIKQREKKEEIENDDVERDDLIKINISQDIIHVLRVNWELDNDHLKTHIHWVLLLLILKVDKYKERPKGMKKLDDYNDCLHFIKNHHKLLLRSNLSREEKIKSTQRACIAFFDNLFKIKSKWSSINSEEYLQLSRGITSSQLYIRWMELFKVDPPRSQWLILRKLAINQFDEILRLLKILTKNTDEYKSLENILIEFMTQFNSYCKDYELNDKLCKLEMKKYLKDDHFIGLKDKFSMIKTGSKNKKKNKRNFRIYLPEEMPDLYVYHHQVNTCVLNLGIMSLFPELKVFFYDVFKRKPTYYLFHRKPITVSRKTLLRSNQLCNLMLELTNRLERSYYLLNIKEYKFLHYQDTDAVTKSNSNKLFIDNFNLSEYILKRGLVKPLSFHPYYYSNPLDIEIQIIFINWLFISHFEKQSLIKSLKGYTKNMEKKHKNLFLNAKLDLLKNLISEDEQILKNDLIEDEKKLKDGLFLSYFQKIANILKNNADKIIKYLNSLESRVFNNIKLYNLIDQENPSPNVFSLIPMVYLNSKLWSVQKFLYKYPVSVKVNLKKIVSLSETLKIGEKKLGDIKVGDISTCIKVITIFWKNQGIKINNRNFKIINPNNLSELYEKSNELSEIYMDYATIYLLCVKSVSQSLIYYKRIFKYYFGDHFDNNWKLNILLDMNNEDSSNSFQYINKKNINLHSLPNDFIMPSLTRGVYISILSAYLLLTVGAVCIQSLITIIF